MANANYIIEVPLESRGKFRIGFNEHGENLKGRKSPHRGVFVEVRGASDALTDARYGVFSVEEAKRVIAKLQEVVDHYENYQPIDALGLGAVVQPTNELNEVNLFVNIGGSWSTTNGAATASHAAVNSWLKKGTARVVHEGYKSGGDN
jgi:hypothetical protein